MAGYAIDSADPLAERDAIVALWQRNFPVVPRGRFDWLYGAGGEGRGTCLLLRDGAGSLVGCAGLVERQVLSGNEWIAAAQAVDLVIDRSHRSFGPAVLLQRRLMECAGEKGYRLIYGFPLAGAEMVQRKLGFRPLGVFQRWTKPLRFERVLRRYVASGLARRALAAIVEPSARLLSRDRWRRLAPGSRVADPGEIGDGYDALWRRAAGSFEAVGDRGAGYLRWRFCSPGVARPELFELWGPEGLDGYLVFQIEDPYARVLDVFFADRAMFPDLLAAFLRSMRERGVSAVSVSLLAGEPVARVLRSFGFVRRPSDLSVVVRMDEALAAERPGLLDGARWFMSEADRDV